MDFLVNAKVGSADAVPAAVAERKDGTPRKRSGGTSRERKKKLGDFAPGLLRRVGLRIFLRSLVPAIAKLMLHFEGDSERSFVSMATTRMTLKKKSVSERTAYPSDAHWAVTPPLPAPD